MENDRLFDLRDYNNLTQKAVGELWNCIPGSDREAIRTYGTP